LDSQKLADMNNSDRNNPRRLIRAIEVAEQDKSRDVSTSPLPKWQSDNLNIGLTASKDHLKQRVVSSVRKRASSEFAKELTTLEKKEFDWSSPAASATGYKEWQGYLSGEISRREAVKAWITREHQYQKRQLTWFKKNPMINWFDVENKQLYSSVEDKLQAWYS